MGATVALNVKHGSSLDDVQAQLGMQEGFDVGLEMSGNPAALQSMIGALCHGGKIAMLGIPNGPIDVDWNKVVFNMLTIKGIYGREMYEDLVQDERHAAKRFRHHAHYHPPFLCSPTGSSGFEVMSSGQSGKVILRLGIEPAQQNRHWKCRATLASKSLRDYRIFSAAGTFIHQQTGTAVAALEGFQCRFQAGTFRKEICTEQLKRD